MTPSQLTTESFRQYLPIARTQAALNLSTLQKLPLALAALLLRELIQFDWKFPAERRELEQQFRYLSQLSNAGFSRDVAPFAALRLSSALEQTDWVNNPALFSERFTAHLWATHQIEGFRAAAVDYVQRATRSASETPLPTYRLGMVVIGQGVSRNSYPLFRKLRAQGCHYTNLVPDGGMDVLIAAVSARAAAHPDPYAHWYVDGGHPVVAHLPNVSCVSYQSLTPARLVLQAQMRKTYEAGKFDPEAFRSMLARTSPSDLGLVDDDDPLLNRFATSLLTEGSGTQVFATSFVQWAAREVLRRAQPLTLLARFAPRQAERPMQELLDEAHASVPLDATGSLIDADMAAYSTWINQQRISEPGKTRFMVWWEGQTEAILVGGDAAKATKDNARIPLKTIVDHLTATQI